MSSLEGVGNATTQFVKDNIGTITAGAGGLILGGTVGYIAGSRSAKKKSGSRKRVSNRTSRKGNYRNKKRKGRYTPHTAGKGKDTSHKRIRYTKNGQPYVIMGNGRARFIKKKGARRSHKTSGGRY